MLSPLFFSESHLGVLLIPPTDMTPLIASRRTFLQRSVASCVTLIAVTKLAGCGGSGSGSAGEADSGFSGGIIPPEPISNLTQLGPLQEPDANGCRLPAGFNSRIVANSSETVPGTTYTWHAAPDGGACFADEEGWIYVSNSEVANSEGGVSAIRFAPDGDISEAYSILDGTSDNCAGGITPWHSWLSCEENGDSGRVFECDPQGVLAPIERPALGYFNHEAVAYDTYEHVLYLTEDRGAGRLYRFTPEQLNSEGYADLGAGVLEVAEIVEGEISGPVRWHPVPDPAGLTQPTRYQVPESTAFDGGEGIVYYNGDITFSTKGDNRVWTYDTRDATIAVLYDDDTSETPILSGVDNIASSLTGEYLVAEDAGDMQVVVLSETGEAVALLQLIGHDHSEITGVAFSPDRSRLYFSSQRGVTGHSADGITFEVSGPFFS
jgi:WD40 repeat protein